jgi:4-amino-4-deoxy-L-arabinose transferase-like glycosyltransferase
MHRVLPGVALGMALAAALYFPGLGTLPFYDKGEPREVLSLVAQTETGNWILPLTGGTTIPSKPPLLRWSSGAVVAATGRLDEWATRLPSAMLAMVTVAVVAAAAGARFGTFGGVTTALVLATTWTWILAAREARVDMPLTACLTMALLALERVCRAPVPSRGALVALYASAALAVLAKGPVGVAVPGVVGLAYLTLRHDLGRLRRMRLGLGVVVVLLMAGTWYALAAWQGGHAFLARQLGHENVARFLGGSGHTSHAKPFYYYAPAFLMGFMPWTLLLVPAVVHLVLLRGRLGAAGLLFPLVWLCGVVGFFSFAAGKRSIYLLPAYPSAALLVGALFDPTLEGRAAFARTASVLGALVWVLLLGLVAGMLAVLLGGGEIPAGVVGWLHPKDRRGLELVVVVMRQHAPATALLLGVLAGALAVLLAGLRRQRPALILAGLGEFTVAVALVANAVVHPALARERTLREFARAVGARVPPEAELRFVGPQNGGMRFYLDRPLPMAKRPIHQADDPQRCRYLLAWKSRWRQIRPETRAMLEPVLKSTGSGPEGDDRLLLLRVRSPVCAEQASPSPIARVVAPCEQGGHDPRHLG